MKRRDGDAGKKIEDRRQMAEGIVVIRYPLFGRSVAMNCRDDFYDFYDLNDSNDLNGLNDLNGFNGV